MSDHKDFIVHLIQSKVIPWTSPGLRSGIVAARPVINTKDLPKGVTATRRQLVGKREIVRSHRKHNNRRHYTAFWPKDNLQEITTPRISCTVEGTADFLLSEYIVRCPQGIFVAMPPGIPQQRRGPYLQGSLRKTGHCIVMHAYASHRDVLLWICRSDKDKHTNNFSENFLFSNPTLAQLLTISVNEINEDKTSAKSVSFSCLSAFFTIAVREIMANQYIALGRQQEIPASKHLANNFVGDVQKYIETNCCKPIKARDVARHMYMSESLFYRRMHESGIKFTDLLTQYRMEFAQQLLCDTDFTVKAICNVVCYRSPTYFQNLFRDYTGKTPLEYRSWVRSNTPHKNR